MDITTLPQQCLVFVQNVLGIHSDLAPTAASAAGEFQNAGFQRVSGPGAAAVGDIVQFQPGQFGVGSAGHVGIISALTPNGATLINANWGPGTNSGQGTAPSFLNITNTQLASLATYEGPSGSVEKVQAVASRMAQQGASAFSLSGAAGSAAPSNATLTAATTAGAAGTNSSACTPLGEILQQSGTSGFLGGIPVLGGIWTAATTPDKLIEWAIQPCVRWRIALGLGALVVLGLGLSVTFRKDAMKLINASPSASGAKAFGSGPTAAEVLAS